MWAKLDRDIVWESDDVKLLGIALDNNLIFYKQVLNICSKANNKRSQETKPQQEFPSFFHLRKDILFKAFIELQFKYCPLVWMFHGRQINKINKLHERALRIVYNDTIMSFEELLVKDKTFTTHYQNTQSLAIDMYKAVNNLPGGNLSEFFVRNNQL